MKICTERPLVWTCWQHHYYYLLKNGKCGWICAPKQPPLQTSLSIGPQKNHRLFEFRDSDVAFTKWATVGKVAKIVTTVQIRDYCTVGLGCRHLPKQIITCLSQSGVADSIASIQCYLNCSLCLPKLQSLYPSCLLWLNHLVLCESHYEYCFR